MVEFKVRSNFHAEPHTRLYVNQEFGFFGFEKNQMIWLKEQEIPARALKSINRTPGCPKPSENKFEPKSYSNCISKIHPDSEETVSLIQVWFDKK